MTDKAYRILVAEDNDVNLKLITKVLTKLNHIPVTAYNGHEVLQLLQHSHFDFILMDIQMPEMDGLETTRQIVASLQPPIRPIIIAMTASAMKGDREQCLHAGMDDYLSKPIIIKELEEKLDDWGEQRRGKLELQKRQPFQLHQLNEPNHVISLERLALLHALQPHKQELEELFQFFFAQCQEMLEQLRRASAEGAPTAIPTYLHHLKGTCLNYGAVQVAEVCEQWEHQLQDNRWADGSTILARLETSLALTIRQIRAWLNTQA